MLWSYGGNVSGGWRYHGIPFFAVTVLLLAVYPTGLISDWFTPAFLCWHKRCGVFSPISGTTRVPAQKGIRTLCHHIPTTFLAILTRKGV